MTQSLTNRTPLPLSSARKHPKYHWFVVATVCIGAFMAALDASIINIALPTLQAHFHTHMHIVEWVSLVYLLTLTALVVPLGKLADMLGRRWMYTGGFLVFIVGSVLCGFSGTLMWLLVFRVVQAVGAAMLQANSVSIITANTPAHDRGKAIGIQAAAQGVGLTLGPAVGGAFLQLLTWRWIFFLNLPVGLVGTAFGLLLLPRDNATDHKERFDLLGATVLAPTLVALIFVLNMGAKAGWISPAMLVAYVVFAVGLLVFLALERRAEHPLVNLRMFGNPVFSIGTITGVLSFAVMYAVLLLGPFYLDYITRLNSFQSGLVLTTIPIGMTLLTPVAGAIADKRGTRLPTALGMMAACAGCGLLALMLLNQSFALLFAGLFLTGAGVGLFTPANNSSVMGSVPSNYLGVTGGMLNMARSLGMGLGIALGGLSYQVFLFSQGVVNEHNATRPEMLIAFRWSFIIVGLVAVAALLLTSMKRSNQSPSSV